MTPFELLFGTEMMPCQDIEIVELLNDEIAAQFQEQRDALRPTAPQSATLTTIPNGWPENFRRTATAGSDVVQSGRPILDDFFQHLWPYIGNVVFQMVKRLWLIRIDQ
ncbi:hypothetical protein TNCV_3813601 [Trichonephila clavipes]|nr:hypothetical protein TNCV_3813601 [Trichonephila clavipes]